MLDVLDSNKTEKIRSLNDNLRRTFSGGRVLLTQGVLALPEWQVADVAHHVMTFTDFSVDNDPHHEHDFGAFDSEGEKIFWKIDYYDLDCNFGSPDPANPQVTTRVLTIFLASEY